MYDWNRRKLSPSASSHCVHCAHRLHSKWKHLLAISIWCKVLFELNILPWLKIRFDAFNALLHVVSFPNESEKKVSVLLVFLGLTPIKVRFERKISKKTLAKLLSTLSCNSSTLPRNNIDYSSKIFAIDSHKKRFNLFSSHRPSLPIWSFVCRTFSFCRLKPFSLMPSKLMKYSSEQKRDFS